MLDEGYIKFECRWIEGEPPPEESIAALKCWRDRLRRLGLIGVYPDGIGYGNVSVRDGEDFLITGTQTGDVEHLEARHVTRVVEVDIDANSLACIGPVRASSESMTHAAIYLCDRSIGAVVHIHHLPTWRALMGILPTTDRSVPYGTPAMARELERLYRESDFPARRLAVMAGHEEGIIGFGRDLEEAGMVVVEGVKWEV